MSSFLLFNKLSPLFKMMWSFSVRHKWQSLVPPLYGCAYWIIFHDTLYGSCLSFNSHTFLESSVWFRSFSSLKELVCALKRVLKVFSAQYICALSFPVLLQSLLHISLRLSSIVLSVGTFLVSCSCTSLPLLQFLPELGVWCSLGWILRWAGSCRIT